MNNRIKLVGVALILVAVVMLPAAMSEARERGERTGDTERDRPSIPTSSPNHNHDPIVVPKDLLEEWRDDIEAGNWEEVVEEFNDFVDSSGVVESGDAGEDGQDGDDGADPEEMEDGDEEVVDPRIERRDRHVERTRGGTEDVDEEETDENTEEEENSDIAPGERDQLSYEEKVAAELHRLTNEVRVEEGLDAISLDHKLAEIAESHSVWMSDSGIFSHTRYSEADGEQGCSLSCRLAENDYEALAWAENIAWRSQTNLPDAKDLAAVFFASWMNSAGHRDNILDENYNATGIGVAKSGNKVFATVDFATI